MENEQPETILRVGGKTSVADLAAAISHGIYDSKRVVLRAIGHGATGQAVKAVAVARGYVAPRGLSLALIPGFTEIPMPVRGSLLGETELVTAMVLRVIVL